VDNLESKIKELEAQIKEIKTRLSDIENRVKTITKLISDTNTITLEDIAGAITILERFEKMYRRYQRVLSRFAPTTKSPTGFSLADIVSMVVKQKQGETVSSSTEAEELPEEEPPEYVKSLLPKLRSIGKKTLKV